ncbi:MAG: hypothetical protein WBQ73_03085, partial [Candidatus Babeliales bacterium]
MKQLWIPFKILSTITLFLLLHCTHLFTFYAPQWYKAPPFFGEPRLTKDYLSSGYITLSRAHTHQSRNNAGDETCLLNIYGKHNMRLLGSGVPNKDITHPIDLILIQLETLPERKGFAELLYTGNMKLTETTFTFMQNITRGSFFLVRFPFVKLELNSIDYVDCSPNDSDFPNRSAPEWQTFLTNFDAILERYNLSTQPYSKQDPGTITLATGWSSSYLDSTLLDYLDLTIMAGLLIPPGQKTDPNKVFDIPLDYDHHLGFMLSFDTACGICDWFSCGLHLSGAAFRDEMKENLRMKTNINHNGFIALAQGKADVNKGSLWNVGLFTKADHVIFGLSVLISYLATHKRDDVLYPKDTSIFTPSIVNHDERYKPWT